MNRHDWLWVSVAVSAHLTLFLVSDWQAYSALHDAVFYREYLSDPLLQDVSWGNLTYWGLRVGFILLALPFRWLGVVPALVLVSLIAVAAGVVAIRRISGNDRVASAIWVANPGAMMSTVLILPDTIAWTAILWSLVLMQRRRLVLASVVAVLAVLTKEASLAALGLAGLVAAWSGRDRRLLVPFASAGVAYALWFRFLVISHGPSIHDSFVTWPLFGWVEVVGMWGNRPLSAVLGVFILASGFLVLGVWLRRWRDVYLAAASGQAGLMFLLHAALIAPMSNSTRFGGLFWPMLAARRQDSFRRIRGGGLVEDRTL